MIDPSQGTKSKDTWKRLASRRLLTHAVAHNGLARDALLYAPQHVRLRRGLPLVVVLHGGASSPETIARRSAMHRLAEEAGFVVAYPRGTPGNKDLTWHPAGNKAARKADDARFVRALIDDLQRRFEIDPDRIYAAGFSIGGSLVYELAGLMADRLAAVAVVAGAMTAAHFEPAVPLPLIHIHGTADRRVPLKGGRGTATRRVGEWSPVSEAIVRWRAINGCAGPAEIVRQPLQGVTIHRHVGVADVELWLVEGGTHVWPGAQYSILEQRTRAPADVFSASETIWRFFAAHPRPRVRLSGSTTATALT